MDHLKRGDAALAEGRYAAALAAYGHARELAPTDPEVQRAMMRARLHLIAESAGRLSLDAIEDARYEAELLRDTDPSRAHVYLTALANVKVRQGDTEGAKLLLAEALKADPTSWLAHMALGKALMVRKEDAPKAKAELEAALKAKPDAVGALTALGQIKLAEGDTAGAVDKLEAALRSGDDYEVRMALGRARMQEDKPGDAAPHFQRAAQLDPKSADALLALGQALLNMGRAEDAERALRSSIAIRPDAEGTLSLGFALARQKKLDPALALFNQSLTQDPSSARALYGAGAASQELGRREQALDFYRRLMDLPASGPEGRMVSEMQRDARSRIEALSPTPDASASPKGAERLGF